MKRFAAALTAVALCACDALPPERTPDQTVVEDAFMDWVDALVVGNATAAYLGLSELNKSQWLFDLLRGEDRGAHDWRLKLDAQTRTDVDLWYNYFKDKAADLRVQKLGSSVLDSPEILALWRRTFDGQKESIRLQMSKVQVTEVYTDGAAASLTVRNILGKTEIYELIFERGGWKINHHRAAVEPANR